MVLGKEIARCRKNLGLTQEALAQELGVTNQAVSKWELDQACPDIALLPKLADLFHITLDELFGRKTADHQFEFEKVFGISLDELEKKGNKQKQRPDTACVGADWPDDGVLRVVAYEGRKLICGGAAEKDFHLDCRQDVKKILSAVSINCGDVGGDVYAVGNVNCGDVDGDVDAGASVACGDVGGDVDAGANVACGNVDGDVDAGANVTCGNVEGSVDAGGDVHIG